MTDTDALRDEARRLSAYLGTAPNHDGISAAIDLIARLVAALALPARQAQQQPTAPPSPLIAAALSSPACSRLRDWAAIGPVQLAAVESFADLLHVPLPAPRVAQPLTEAQKNAMWQRAYRAKPVRHGSYEWYAQGAEDVERVMSQFEICPS